VLKIIKSSTPRCLQLTAAQTAREYIVGGAMAETSERDAINKGMRTLWFIWGAMLGSLLIYIFICYQLSGEIRKSVEGSGVPVELLRNIFAGVGVVELLMAYFMRRSMLSVRTEVPQPKPIERITGWNTVPFMFKYATAVIIPLAFSESIGIYGLVLFLLGDSFQTLYTFIGVSALAMVFYRPKREELKRLAMAYKQASEISH
jgi:hypothetical protein